MTIELSGDEQQVLLDFIEQHLAEVQVETRRTESRAYRDELKHREALLEQLLERLRGLVAQTAHS